MDDDPVEDFDEGQGPAQSSEQAALQCLLGFAEAGPRTSSRKKRSRGKSPASTKPRKKAKLPVATPTTAGGDAKTATAVKVEPKPKPKASRKDKSLGLLCSKFLRLYDRKAEQPNEVMTVSLDAATDELKVERRRVYDIVNILESVNVVAKQGKNNYTWYGKSRLAEALAGLQRELDSKEEQVPPKKELALGNLSKTFIKKFLVSKTRVVSVQDAAKELVSGGEQSEKDAQLKSKVRRLYDIANVLTALTFPVVDAKGVLIKGKYTKPLLKKVNMIQNPHHTRTSAYMWEGAGVYQLESSLDASEYTEDNAETRAANNASRRNAKKDSKSKPKTRVKKEKKTKKNTEPKGGHSPKRSDSDIRLTALVNAAWEKDNGDMMVDRENSEKTSQTPTVSPQQAAALAFALTENNLKEHSKLHAKPDPRGPANDILHWKDGDLTSQLAAQIQDRDDEDVSQDPAGLEMIRTMSVMSQLSQGEQVDGVPELNSMFTQSQ